jgi:hypothetical protein
MHETPYEPRSSELKNVRSRISEASWAQRVSDARRRLAIVEQILRLIEQGKSQNAAIGATVDSAKRSATLRDLKAYRNHGFEGLIDRRTPREPKVSQQLQDALEVARMANPSLTTEQMEAILQAKFQTELSSSTIKRTWRRARLERSPGRPRLSCQEADDTGTDDAATDDAATGDAATGDAATGDAATDDARPVVEPLQAAGMQLALGAAEAETGAIERLVDTVKDVAASLPEPEPVSDAERALRDERGRLTAQYNQARRKRDDEPIGPAFRSAAQKAQDRALGRLSFRDQSRATLERKVLALICLPLVTPMSGRIEDLRGPRGQLLGELCGFEYQAETVRKVASEFVLAGLGPLLQQTQAETWHDVSIQRWETDYRASIVYVDKLIKPLWTKSFTKAAKVSSTGRVQPALTSTYINTGVGTPIHVETHSGSAPLAPRVLQMLQEAEERSEHPLGRLTVIDGECFSAGLLKSFKDAERDLIVPLPATLTKPERFRFGRGSGFRSYRDNDQLREGMITLQDSKDRDVCVDARAVIIERRSTGAWTVLVTLAEPQEWSARELADAYFGRWPNQEGFFRRGNQALGLKQIHGYGKRVVANTVVLDKLDKTESRIDRARAKQDEAIEDLECVEQELATARGELRKVERYRAKREERVDAALDQGRVHTKPFSDAVTELRDAAGEERTLRERSERLEARRDKLGARVAKRGAQLDKWQRERDELQTRTEIVEADVAQDTLMTAMKLTLGMLVQFIVAEYFEHRSLAWETFLSRIATLPGRRETTADSITVYIYGNRRDIALMRDLERACRKVNERGLIKDGKRLRYAVEWPQGAPKGWAE